MAIFPLAIAGTALPATAKAECVTSKLAAKAETPPPRRAERTTPGKLLSRRISTWLMP